MTMDRLLVSDSSVLAFAPHIVFRFDEVRQKWIILAPERLMLPDEQAVEILKLVDGKTGVAAIVSALAARYTQAPRELIAKAVTPMRQHLADKGCLAGANDCPAPRPARRADASLSARLPLLLQPGEPGARRGRAWRAGLAPRARPRGGAPRAAGAFSPPR